MPIKIERHFRTNYAKEDEKKDLQNFFCVI